MFFGKKPKPVDVNATLIKNSDTIESHNQKIAHLEKCVQAEHQNVLMWSKKGNKAAATNALKKKRMYQSQINNLNNQIMNITSVGMKVEQTVTSIETFKVQKEGASTMKQMMKQNNITSIENSLDDIIDTLYDANEITDIVSQELMPEMFDDISIDAELEEISSEVKEEINLGIPSRKLPDKKIPEKDDEALEKLKIELWK